MALSRLARVVVLVRDVRSSVAFYTHGLGLPLRTQTASHARLSLGGGVDLDLTTARRCVD